jgi:hypothetical protein
MKSKRAGNCFTTTVYPLDRDGEEHEVSIRVHYDCDYEPAYTSGLPENCYPASGDMVLTEIEILNELPAMITDADVRAAAEDAEDRLVQEAWDDYHSQGADGE